MASKENSSVNENCPVSATIRLIGGKYKALLLWHLTGQTLRFNQLHRLVPEATPKMLTQQLRELEEDGLITRTVYPVVPPRVDYSLTALGESLFPILEAMYRWGSALMQDEGLTPACTMTDSPASTAVASTAVASTSASASAQTEPTSHNAPSTACCENNAISSRQNTKKEQESCPSCSCHARLKS